jgi:hypothetical protein
LLFGNNVRLMGCTWLPKLSTCILPCSNSTMKGNNGTDRILYHDIAAQTVTSPVFHYRNQAFRIVGFLGCSPDVNSCWRREQREGRLMTISSFSCCLVVWCPGFMVVTPSFTHLSITFSSQRFSNCNPTVNVGFVTLTLDSFVETEPSRWIFISAVLSRVLQ